MTTQSGQRTFYIRNSEKCYRFKPEAIVNHAPMNKGIYELVSFDADQKPHVLFVGLAYEKSISEHLEGHLNGTMEPKAQELLAKHENLYFDFISEMNAKSLDDARDVHWWLIQKYKPQYNDLAESANSGRMGSVEVKELD